MTFFTPSFVRTKKGNKIYIYFSFFCTTFPPTALDRTDGPAPSHKMLPVTKKNKNTNKLVLVRADPGTTRPVCCQRALLISKSDCSEVWAGRPTAELSELSSMAAVRRRRRVPEGSTILFNNTAREEENEEEKRPTLYATTSAVIQQLFIEFLMQLHQKLHSWIFVLVNVGRPKF